MFGNCKLQHNRKVDSSEAWAQTPLDSLGSICVTFA